MDTPPPVPAPAAPQPQVVLPPPKSSGCGCCAGGCLTFIFAAFVGCIILAFAGWFLCLGAVKKFTSDNPADIKITVPADGEFNAASAKFAQLKNALATNQRTTIAFTAGDLNALIARHPDFATRKNRMHVALADSMATLDVSVPLNAARLPWMKHRWFNGSTRLRFSYDDNDFHFDPEWIEANGHQISGSFLRAAASSFGHSFTAGFEESLRKNNEHTLWPNVKTITLQGNQLIITTQGPPGT
ncbi:MAG: hypothetical protein M3128_14010 [Verrucomicrobiota bacterium]|nr:hypothetical protein [Verrucomicrobiota bacterium]